ncbi:MAG: signal peptide peptidase SppA [Pseudomonadota bacterium]
MALADDIIDRQRLRKKLGVWRIVAILALILLVGALAVAGGSGGFSSAAVARDHIAHIRVSGMITGGTDILERLDRIAASDRAQAVIVTIDSPGGTTTGGEAVYEAVRRIAEKKPTVAQINGTAASAAYMVASATDHIIARQSSIVGSIGVIFQFPKVDQLLENIGVEVNAIRSTPLKAEPNFFGETPPEAIEMMEALIDDSYQWFRELVAERRGFNDAQLNRLSDGSIFTGRQSVENGLIDGLGGMIEARTWLESQDGVTADLPVVEYEPTPPRPSLFFANAVVDSVIRRLGFEGHVGGELGRLTDSVFLDGLVSVWHVGGKAGGAGR